MLGGMDLREVWQHHLGGRCQRSLRPRVENHRTEDGHLSGLLEAAASCGEATARPADALAELIGEGNTRSDQANVPVGARSTPR
jgi:hypothetical protein